MIITKLSAVPLMLAAICAAEHVPRTPDARLYVRDDKPTQGSYPVKLSNPGLDSLYKVTVKIGNPPQNFSFPIDSEQTLLAFPSENYMGGSKTRKNVTKPDDIDAKTVPHGRTWASDQITVGNETADTVFAVDNQTITTGPSSFGFACTYGPKWATQSFWVKAAANWPDKQLGLFLSRHKDLSKDTLSGFEDSEIIAGGVNRSKINGEITYFPFTPGKEGYWVVPLQSLTVNGTVLELGGTAGNSTSGNSTAATNGTAAPGSGGANGTDTAIQARIVTHSYSRTSGLSLPGTIINATVQNVPGAKYIGGSSGWVIPCDAVDKLDVRLNIGGKEYPIKSRDLLHSKSGFFETAAGEVPASAYCKVALHEAESNTDYSIGPAFLLNVYTAFRFDPPAVGFAQLADNAQPQTQPKSKSWAAPVSSGYLSFGVAGAAVAAMIFSL